MSLLVKFLQLLLESSPELIVKVKEVLGKLVAQGHVSAKDKAQLIKEIRPTKDKEIDEQIDKEVAETFPASRDEEAED